MAELTLQEQFGEIDIYLFDQLLKGRIRPGMRIFDAGCKHGRNIVYFLREGYDVSAVDIDAESIGAVRGLAQRLAPSLPPENFRVEAMERSSFGENWADVVICSAVLHLAADEAQFDAMLRGAWGALKPGGLFFSRIASTIGVQDLVKPVAERRYKLPDGTERFLVDEALLDSYTERLGATLEDPLKTTIVRNLRAMTTWVLRKNAG
ncbi:MAG: class I SAM-dependent methyltransferase [Bryobacterales bacterium]|nr:class I SAM-dependent methyltransferase [Bryobacterales bacterium]